MDIVGYRIELQRLHKLCSQGAEAESAIIKAQARRLDYLDESREGRPSREILAGLLRGDFGKPEDATKTAYVLESVCAWLGEELPPIRLYPLDNLMEVTKEWDKRLAMPMKLFRVVEGPWDPPVPIPSPKDVPMIVTYGADEVAVTDHRAEVLFRADRAGPDWARFRALCTQFREMMPDPELFDDWFPPCDFELRADESRLKETLERFEEIAAMLTDPVYRGFSKEEMGERVEEKLRWELNYPRETSEAVESIYGLFEWTHLAWLKNSSIVCFCY